MDRIETMKAFVTVSELGSFTKAADRLGMSNQLVSKYVSDFEEHLGARLFNRTTRTVRLTQEGEQCLEHARDILERIQDMEGGLGQLKGEAKGLLRISAPVSFSIKQLAPLIKDFKQAYPSVGIDLQLNDRQVDIVEEGFDLALRIGRLKNSSLVAKRIAPTRLVLVASPEYLKKNGTPEHPDDLIPSHHLHYSYMAYNQAQSPLMNALQRSVKSLDTGISSNNGDVLVEAAIVGEGYALQPTFLVSDAIKHGLLTPILCEFEPESIGLYAVYPHRKLITTKLRSFIDFISTYYGDEPRWDQF